jgi:hypothetical protein
MGHSSYEYNVGCDCNQIPVTEAVSSSHSHFIRALLFSSRLVYGRSIFLPWRQYVQGITAPPPPTLKCTEMLRPLPPCNKPVTSVLLQACHKAGIAQSIQGSFLLQSNLSFSLTLQAIQRTTELESLYTHHRCNPPFSQTQLSTRRALPLRIAMRSNCTSRINEYKKA